MDQRKSILFLSRLYHPHIGGVEKHVSEISKILIEKGYFITVITEQIHKKDRTDVLVDGVRILRIPIHNNSSIKKFFIWKWIFFNLRIFLSADVIHIHDVFYWILPFRLILVAKKIYITFHGYEGYPIKKRWKIQRKIAEKLTFGSICVGRFMKKWYNASPSSVIYGGVRLNIKNIAEKNNSALFFGRLDDQTGIKEYMDAFLLIKKKIPKFKLTIIGEGLLRIKKQEGLKILPFKKNIDVYLAQSEYIFVSRYLSFLEALTFGKKIIATYDNPVKRDYLLMSPYKNFIEIGKTGAEIADIVLKSIKNKVLFERKAKKGRVWAQKQTWESVVDVYLRLWGLK